MVGCFLKYHEGGRGQGHISVPWRTECQTTRYLVTLGRLKPNQNMARQSRKSVQSMFLPIASTFSIVLSFWASRGFDTAWLSRISWRNMAIEASNTDIHRKTVLSDDSVSKCVTYSDGKKGRSIVAVRLCLRDRGPFTETIRGGQEMAAGAGRMPRWLLTEADQSSILSHSDYEIHEWGKVEIEKRESGFAF